MRARGGERYDRVTNAAIHSSQLLAITYSAPDAPGPYSCAVKEIGVPRTKDEGSSDEDEDGGSDDDDDSDDAVKQPTERKKKQPTEFDLVGKWVAIEYNADDSTVAEPEDGDSTPPQKVLHNGLVKAYDANLHSYRISWEGGGEEWIDDLD